MLIQVRALMLMLLMSRGGATLSSGVRALPEESVAPLLMRKIQVAESVSVAFVLVVIIIIVILFYESSAFQ